MTSSILGWLFLIFLQTCVGLVYFYFGINWQTVETKYRYSPIKSLVVLYITNFILLNACTSHTPFWFQFLVGVIHVASVYFGTYF